MATTSALPNYSVIYAFGDSLSDAGNLSLATALAGQVPVSPPYYQENYGLVSANVFSNGPTWVQDLSLSLGLGTLEPSLLNGNDFAYGGAETGSTPQNAGNTALDAISLPSQLAQYEAGVSNPPASALFTLSIGSNDLLDILSNTTLSAAQQTTDVTDAVDNEVGFVNALVKDGAKNLLILNVPDLGKTPSVLDGQADGSDTPSASFDSLASALAGEYNADLAGLLATVQGAAITVVNAYQLIDDAVSNPGAYGLINVTAPVWSGSYSVASSGSLATTGTAQDQYLFFDHLHPTETGELAVAALAKADLTSSTVTATTPDQVIPLTAGNTVVFVTAPETIDQSGGANTIITSAGNLTVNATGGSSLIFDAVGGDVVNEAPSSEFVGGPSGGVSTIIAASGGSDTIYPGGPVLYNGTQGANSLFVGGAGMAVVQSAAHEIAFGGTGGGLYQPGSSSFFFFGGGGADTITGGAAAPTLWGNSGEDLTVGDTAGKGIFYAYGTGDTIDAAAAGGGNAFIAVDQALANAAGTFSGNTTLVGSSAGGDEFVIQGEAAPPPAHAITIENWQASDTLFLGYGASDVATAESVLSAGGSNVSFTLSDQTTVTFLGAHPTAVA